MHSSKKYVLWTNTKDSGKKKLGQSYRFRSDPSNGDLDKGRKKNVISGTTEWNGEPLPMKPKKI